jgi:hypothetical protein
MLALPYLPTIYIKERYLPPLTQLMLTIYLLQAEFETEVVGCFFWTGFQGSSLACSWLLQLAVGLFVLAI